MAKDKHGIELKPGDLVLVPMIVSLPNPTTDECAVRPMSRMYDGASSLCVSSTQIEKVVSLPELLSQLQSVMDLQKELTEG